MASINQYDNMFTKPNIFKNECLQIVENIRKCINTITFEDKSSSGIPQRPTLLRNSGVFTKHNTTFMFQEKQQQFLLLNIHCEQELQTLTKELNRTKTRFDYKIVYNTQQPYHILYDKTHNQVSITQHTFL